MYPYMHMYKHTIYIYLHSYIYIPNYLSIYVYTYICTHMYIYIYMYNYTSMYLYINVHIHIRIYTLILCKQYGLPGKGNKNELVRRLLHSRDAIGRREEVTHMNPHSPIHPPTHTAHTCTNKQTKSYTHPLSLSHTHTHAHTQGALCSPR